MSPIFRRFSISRLMIVVVVAAADCGLLRFIWNTGADLALLIGPMLNLLLLGVPRLRPGRETRQFWVGFESVGLVSVGLIMLLFYQTPNTLLIPFYWLVDLGVIDLNNFAIALTCYIVIYTLPQIVAAMVAGWLSAGYRVKIKIVKPQGLSPFLDHPPVALSL